MSETKNMSGAVKYLQKAAVGAMLVTITTSFAFTPLTGVLEASAVEQSSYNAMTKSLSSHSYSDVQADHPAYESIQYAAENNLFGDGGTGKFNPDAFVNADMIFTSTAAIFGFAADTPAQAKLSLARSGAPYLLGADKATYYLSSKQFILLLAYLVDGEEYTKVDDALRSLDAKRIISVDKENGKTLSESFFDGDVYKRGEFAVLITRIAKLTPSTHDTALSTYNENKTKTLDELEKNGPSSTPPVTNNGGGQGSNQYFDKDTQRNEYKLSSDDPNLWTRKDYNSEQIRMAYERKLHDIALLKAPSKGNNVGLTARYDSSNNTIRFYIIWNDNGKITYDFFFKKHALPSDAHIYGKKSAIYEKIVVKNKNGISLGTEKKISIDTLSKKEQKLLRALSKKGYTYDYASAENTLTFTKKKIDSLNVLRTNGKDYAYHYESEDGFKLRIPRFESTASVKTILKSYIDAGYLPKKSVSYYYNNYAKMKKGANSFVKSKVRYERDGRYISFYIES